MRELGLDGGDNSEQIRRKLTMLALEREMLRETGSPHETIERNRLEIGRCQYELSHALVRSHLARPNEQQAA